MANTAALLGHLLTLSGDINYYTQQEIYYATKQEATSAKLAKYTKYEESWEKAYDNCFYAEEGKEKKIGNRVFAAGNEQAAEDYANRKVRERDNELLLELTDLDMEYEAMKEMYDTLLEELRAQKDAEKQATSNAAQDTGLLQS